MRGSKFLKTFDFYFGNLIILFLCLLIPLKLILNLVKDDKGRVAILSFGAIGDSLLVLASLEKKFSSRECITIFCSPENYAFYISFVSNKNWQIKKINITSIYTYLKLPYFQFDVIYDFNQWLNISTIISFFLSKKTYGFKTDGYIRDYLYSNKVSHSNDVHEFKNFHSLLKINYTGFKIPNFLKNIDCDNFKKNKRSVVIHPFAGGYNSSMRELPISYWKQIIDFILKKGIIVYLSGSSHDKNHPFYTPNNELFKDVRGNFNLNELSCLLKNSKLVISVNTGVMHLASFLDTSLICINGPTNDTRWGPINNNSFSFNLNQSEGGSFLNLGFEYPNDYRYSMKKHNIDKIIKKIEEFI